MLKNSALVKSALEKFNSDNHIQVAGTLAEKLDQLDLDQVFLQIWKGAEQQDTIDAVKGKSIRKREYHE